MKAVALVHFYPPYRMAGSETMLHTMLRALQDAGHDVEVITTEMPEAPRMWDYDGIRCYGGKGIDEAAACTPMLRPDVLITHHQNAAQALATARGLRIPGIFVQHNTFQMNRPFLEAAPALTVFNTNWVAREWAPVLPGTPYMVLHPPIWASQHATSPGDHVTLVNLNEHKGVHVFYALAREFEHTKFLGVLGGHGRQITFDVPDNVEIIGQTSDMRADVWSRSRVVVMPSAYESYGMVAVEAMASGIPVIANPTPGLSEALGHGGIFAHRDVQIQWSQALRLLLGSQQTWEEASRRALARSRELDPTGELRSWVRNVEALVPARMGVAV